MAPRLSRLIAPASAAIALASGAFAPVSAQATQGPNVARAAYAAGDPVGVGGRQLLTAAALRRAGIVRVGDLPLLANRWDLATVDGINWQVSAHGIAPLADGRWLIVVDGQPLDLGLFGTLDLGRAAVSLAMIDSVEVIDAPTLRAGQVAMGGVLHVHTARPRRGFSAGGWVTTGSEIGDPGPFAFTPDAGINVDRFGHELAARASYGADRWWLEASVNATEYPPTDPALLRRYGDATVDKLRIEGVAPALRGGVRMLGGRHELTYRHSHFDDLFAVAPLGAPVATTERFAHLGLDGAVPVRQDAAELRYFVARGVNRSDGVRGSPAPFAWRTAVWTAGLEGGRGPVDAIGVRFRGVRASGRRDEASVYGRVRPRVPGGLAPVLLASAGVAGGEVAIAVAATERRRGAARSEVRASVGYARRPVALDESIWAWTERGFSYLRDAGIDVMTDGAATARDELAAEIAAAAPLGAAVRGHAAVHWRAADGLTLPRQELHYEPEAESFAGPTRVVAGRGGQLAGADAGLALGAGKLQGEVTYRVRGPIVGGVDFRDAWAAVPRHAARATAAYLPVPGFELQLAASYRSRTRWTDYQDVEAESSGRYRAVVPAWLAVDATVQKWLWDKRLRALIAVQNVTGAPRRYHPAGATWSPALVMQAEAAIP